MIEIIVKYPISFLSIACFYYTDSYTKIFMWRKLQAFNPKLKTLLVLRVTKPSSTWLCLFLTVHKYICINIDR